MLGHLRVANLGVLAEAAIEPATGLTVITGETGAGKTLLLGGLRLLLGAKPDPSAVGPFGDVAQADGLFVTEDEELGITRVVPAEGRSRAHIDGSIVSAATLQEKAGSLIEIVGQHDQVSLRQTSRVLKIIDSTLNEEGRRTLDRYQTLWAHLQQLRQREAELGGNEMILRQELDLVRFQATEIDAASLEEDEDQTLENEASRHRNVSEIIELLTGASNLGEKMLEDGGELVSTLRRLAKLDPDLHRLADQSESVSADLADLASELRRVGEHVEVDPERASLVEQRLNLIGALKRKYGPSMQDVITFGENARQRLDELGTLLEAAGHIESDLRRAREEVAEVGSELTTARRDTASKIATEAESHLADLGLENARLIVEVVPLSDLGARGADQVQVLFSSDEHLEPAPISNVASGGELSRLVLAMRLATSSPETETLVFDEVDSGVGGATALAMGRKLSALADTSQVLCVTHLPQVAAFADVHYVVTRTGKDASVSLVSGEERLQEISRMLAGLPESQAGKDAAAELLAAAATG